VITLRLGSRGSQLALFQARLVAARIESHGGPPCEIAVIKTSGDRLQDAPLSEIGGKRLFVKEIEDALLGGDIDLAVHSCKDMPAVLPDGLEVGAVLEREDPRDALVLPSVNTKIHEGSTKIHEERRKIHEGLEDPRRRIAELMGHGVRIGTGSVRRIAQLRPMCPDSSFVSIRGNLDTRLRKLDAGEYGALVLAAAGLRRLGFGSRISAAISVDDCVPAPGQGIIAVEIRRDDPATRAAAARINDDAAFAAFEAERALVTGLGGGCQMPIGGIARPVGDRELEMRGLVASLDGARIIRYKKVGPRTNSASLGWRVAEALLGLGAADILKELKQSESPIPSPETLRLT
jgi:hydroxymethylbilane synthase